MWLIDRVKIRSYEKGLYFKDKEFKAILPAGSYWFFDPLNKIDVQVASQRDPWLAHKDLDMIIQSGALKENAAVLDLKDCERALVWVDGRFDRILGPGQYVIWTRFRKVRTELVDARDVLFEHKDLNAIIKSREAEKYLSVFTIEEGSVGVFYKDGTYAKILYPGQYAYWLRTGKVKLYPIDMRETVLDVGGQEIMTSDKVTLRLNAIMTYRVADARKAIETVSDSGQALYREAQLALRAVIGTRELDSLLADRSAVIAELEALVKQKAEEFGVQIVGLGIRDIILPGEMKVLLNKVIEAKKASEANLISRREELAAIRSQLNSARLMDENPSLMRLRELEVLEKVAGNSKLNVVLGEKGLADRIVNMI
jgi:regulator of protease activity HflC (stomatin/prohibitin superfamily)